MQIKNIDRTVKWLLLGVGCGVLGGVCTGVACGQPGPAYAVGEARPEVVARRARPVWFGSVGDGLYMLAAPEPDSRERLFHIEASSGRVTEAPRPVRWYGQDFSRWVTMVGGRLLAVDQEVGAPLRVKSREPGSGVEETLVERGGTAEVASAWMLSSVLANDGRHAVFIVQDVVTISDTTLWVTDGTAAGTRQIAGFHDRDLVRVVGSKVLFASAWGAGDSTLFTTYDFVTGEVGEVKQPRIGGDLRGWRVDEMVPTERGTAVVAAGGSLFETDGTESGTRRVTHGLRTNATGVVAVGPRVVFRESGGYASVPLGVTDSVPETLPIVPETQGQAPLWAIGVARGRDDVARLLVRKELAAGGAELWATDGTAEGSGVLVALGKGYVSGQESDSTGRVLVTVTGDEPGAVPRMFVTDGTRAGVWPVKSRGRLPRWGSAMWSGAVATTGEKFFGLSETDELWEIRPGMGGTSYEARRVEGLGFAGPIGLGSEQQLIASGGSVYVQTDRSGWPGGILGAADGPAFWVSEGGAGAGALRQFSLAEDEACDTCRERIVRVETPGEGSLPIAVVSILDRGGDSGELRFVTLDDMAGWRSREVARIQAHGMWTAASAGGRVYVADGSRVWVISPAFGEGGEYGVRSWPVGDGGNGLTAGMVAVGGAGGAAYLSLQGGAQSPGYFYRVTDEGPMLWSEGLDLSGLFGARGRTFATRERVVDGESVRELIEIGATGELRVVRSDWPIRAQEVMEWPTTGTRAGRLLMVDWGLTRTTLAVVDEGDAEFQRPRVLWDEMRANGLPVIVGDGVLVQTDEGVLRINAMTGAVSECPVPTGSYLAYASVSGGVPGIGARPDVAFVVSPTEDGEELWVTDGISEEWSRRVSMGSVAMTHASGPVAVGRGRIVFTGVDGGRDRGTQLYAVNLCAADLTGDGVVDAEDVAAFAGAFEGGLANGDLDGDGAMDAFDVEAFVEAFERGC